MNLASQYCTFWLDDLFFGVRVDHVKEVLRFQFATDVPHAPSEVEGLINLRGDIITAINMRRKLWIKADPARSNQKNLIIKDIGGPVSLIVDEIGDVIHTHIENFETPPATMEKKIREMVLAVYKMENELLLILDIEKIVRDGEHSIAKTIRA